MWLLQCRMVFVRVLSFLLFLSISSLSLRGVLSSPSYSSSYSVLRSLTPGEKCQGFDRSLKLNLYIRRKKNDFAFCFLHRNVTRLTMLSTKRNAKVRDRFILLLKNRVIVQICLYEVQTTLSATAQKPRWALNVQEGQHSLSKKTMIIIFLASIFQKKVVRVCVHKYTLSGPKTK